MLAPARLGQQGNGIYYGVLITSSSSTRRPHRSDNYVAPKAPHTRGPGPVKFHIQIQTQIHLQAHQNPCQGHPPVAAMAPATFFQPDPFDGVLGQFGRKVAEHRAKHLTYISVSHQLRPVLYVPFCWLPLGEGAWLRLGVKNELSIAYPRSFWLDSSFVRWHAAILSA